MPRTSEKPAILPESVHHQLSMYALAASAAGVGVLTLAPPAEARIVYTPAHVQLKGDGDLYALDLAHNGRKDFFLVVGSATTFGFGVNRLRVCHHPFQTSTKGSYACYQTLQSSTNAMNQVVATKPNGPAAALRAGAKIQNGDPFAGFPGHPVGVLMGGDSWNGTTQTNLSTKWNGPWMNGGKGVKNRYLGLKFQINGKFNFGWARLTVTTTHKNFGQFTATLTGYAYETIPNKSIIAGKTKGPDVVTVKPRSLGALAAGASDPLK